MGDVKNLAIHLGVRRCYTDLDMAIRPDRGDPDRQRSLVATWTAFWASATPRDPDAKPWSPHISKAPSWVEANGEVATLLHGRIERAVSAARHCYRHSGEAVRGNFEHFLEEASALQAAISSGYPGVVIDLDVNLGYLLRPEAPLPTYVRVTYRSVYSEAQFTSRYWLNEAFQKASGRPILSVRYEELHIAVSEFAEAGHRTVFLKACATKVGVWRFDVPDGGPKIIRDHLSAMLGDAVLVSRDFLIQPWMPFRREYRFFVIGGKIARGTPCRRLDTILDGTPGVRLEQRSCEAHDGHQSEEDPSRAARYEKAAQDLVQALVQERSNATYQSDSATGLCFVLDMGQTEDDRVLPIEINSLEWAGTYACDTALLLGDLIYAAEGCQARRTADREAWLRAQIATTDSGNVKDALEADRRADWEATRSAGPKVAADEEFVADFLEELLKEDT